MLWLLKRCGRWARIICCAFAAIHCRPYAMQCSFACKEQAGKLTVWSLLLARFLSSLLQSFVRS